MPLKMTQTKVKVEIRTTEREIQNKESKSSIENAFQNTFISFFYSITNENKSAHPSPVRQKTTGTHRTHGKSESETKMIDNRIETTIG